MNLFEYIDILNVPYDIFVSNGRNSSLHWHYYCEMIYVLEGRVCVKGDTEKRICRDGDIAFIYPLQLHEIMVEGKDTARYVVLKFDLHALNIAQAYMLSLKSHFDQGAAGAEMCFVISGSDLSAEIRKLVMDILGEFQAKRNYYRLQVQLYLSSLMVQIARIMDENQYHMQMVSQRGAPGFGEILEYIDAHSGENLKVSKLAEMCHMSYSHFAKMFRERYGRSCKDYINYIRVNKAQEFLLHTDYNLSYIAVENGFFDESHFIHTYKQYKGITPAKERRHDEMENGKGYY